jgi:hypothetical protein
MAYEERVVVERDFGVRVEEVGKDGVHCHEGNRQEERVGDARELQLNDKPYKILSGEGEDERFLKQIVSC